MNASAFRGAMRFASSAIAAASNLQGNVSGNVSCPADATTTIVASASVVVPVQHRNGSALAAADGDCLAGVAEDTMKAISQLGLETACWLPPPSALPPSFPQSGSASGDLHLHYPGGGAADLKGINGAVLNLHQSSNASLNARFDDANFTLAPEDPRAIAVLEIRGSFLTAAYVIYKTVLAD